MTKKECTERSVYICICIIIINYTKPNHIKPYQTNDLMNQNVKKVIVMIKVEYWDIIYFDYYLLCGIIWILNILVIGVIGMVVMHDILY